MRTISKVVGEWCTEEYTVPGRKMVKWVREQECEFDPCTCKCVCKPGKWTKCETQCPEQVCSRRVYRTRTICCEVPVTKNEKECIVEKVPYTVCSMEPCTINKTVSEKVTKMVPHTVTVKVPYTVCEQVPVTTCKRVPVCVEKEVCVKKPRLVAICNEPCDPCHLSRLNDRLCGKGGPCDPGPQAPSDPGTKGGKGSDTKGSGK
jgi:hypothetical protein